MLTRRPLLVLLLAFLLYTFPFLGCGDDDDDNDAGPADDDIVDDDQTDDDIGDDDIADDDDDDTVDDDTIDDDTLPDDDTVDDDTIDDDTLPDDDTVVDDDTAADDYLAPWPQSNVEVQDYNEALSPGYLRQKAEDYFAWSVAHHQPDHGGTVHTVFQDDSYTTPTGYGGYGDCTIWTGTYMASQAFRYYVTGDASAKANVIARVNTLSGHLHVTGRTGFIARYWAPQTSLAYGGDEWCDLQDRCHHWEDGAFAGDWWWGETSRDQYTGWFYGMALAYDLVDDEPMRVVIRADVAEVLDELLATDWMILDEAGEPTDAAPNVLPPMRVAWLLIGYHITGAERFKEALQEWLMNERRTTINMSSISYMNHYGDYYGNNLSHTNFYNLLRLGQVYFGSDDYDYFFRLFGRQVHQYCDLTHNPWFNGIYMSQGSYEPTASADPHQDELVLDLTDFPEVPNVNYYLPERTGYTLDPVSVFLHDLQVQYPWLAELIGEVDYQALEAFPVPLQCSAGFMFQRNPFEIGECGVDNPLAVNEGTDYQVAYWLASYHKFLTKDM